MRLKSTSGEAMAGEGKNDSLRPGVGQVARGVAWVSLEKVVTQILGVGTFLVLARILGPVDFGLVAWVAIVAFFTDIFLEQGFAEALIQVRDLEQDHVDAAFWFAASMGILLGAGLYLSAPLISSLVGEPGLKPLLRLLAAAYPIRGLGSVPLALLRRKMAFQRLALRNTFAGVAGAATALGGAFLGAGASSLVLQTLVTAVVGTVLLWSKDRPRIHGRFSVARFRELASFGIHVAGFNLANFFSRKLDDLVVGTHLGAVPLGIYSVAYKVMMVIQQLLNSASQQIAFPAFSRMQDDPEGLARKYLAAVRLVAFLGFPAFAIVAVFAPWILRFGPGAQWDAAAPVLRALCLAGAIQTISPLNGVVLMAKGKTDLRLRLMVLGVVANGIGFLVAVRWGLVAVALSYSLLSLALYPRWILAVGSVAPVTLGRYIRVLVGPVSVAIGAAGVGACIEFLLTPDPLEITRPWIGLVVSCLVWGSMALRLEPEFLRILRQVVVGFSRKLPRSRRLDAECT